MGISSGWVNRTNDVWRPNAKGVRCGKGSIELMVDSLKDAL